ncbi:MAG: flagellar motor protein MotB [Phycisphaerae bacterium]|jgi:chemotaxis protein MotB
MKSNIVKLAVIALTVMALSGCTDWKKKYEGLNVEHENLKGRYDNAMTALDTTAAEKAAMANRLQSSEAQIADLQSQIEELNKTPGDATGFGDNYEVAFDAEKGTITVVLPNTILFASGKATLKSTVNSDLNYIYDVIRNKYADKQIDVVGHTDSDPISKSKWADNWQLSAERALSVVRYLTGKGIATDRIRACACGESRPVADNSSASGKSKNRRVEIVVNMR